MKNFNDINRIFLFLNALHVYAKVCINLEKHIVFMIILVLYKYDFLGIKHLLLESLKNFLKKFTNTYQMHISVENA